MKRARLADAAASLSLVNLLFWRDWTNLIANVDEGGLEALYLGQTQGLRAHAAIPAYVVLVALVVWWALGLWKAERRPKPARVGLVFLTMGTPFVLFTFGHSAHALWLNRSPWISGFSEKAAGLKRTVVLIFDEMDEGIFFQDQPGQLPNLEKARAESVSAKLAFSPHGCTLLSIPILLTGSPATDAKAVSESSLEVTSPKGNFFLELAPQLFSLAKAAGSRTALVGYFHPYCRLFGKSVDWCRAYSSLEYDYGGFPLPLTFRAESRDRLAHEHNFRAASRDLLTVVANPLFDLVYAHLPVPRPPGLDPAHGGYGEESYRHNGRLADELFAGVRARLEEAGLWESTHLVVTSDHGYRDSARALEPAGVFFRYRHVPLFVKLAGSRESSRYDAPLSMAPFSSWVLGLMKGQITGAEQLREGWKMSPLDLTPVPTPANEYCKLPATPSRVQ